ncbi:MAG: hypothetical protein ACTS44_01465 [Candidatus Hodgkinia cicadicola]
MWINVRRIEANSRLPSEEQTRRLFHLSAYAQLFEVKLNQANVLMNGG